jgi:hypothetical protein
MRLSPVILDWDPKPDLVPVLAVPWIRGKK